MGWPSLARSAPIHGWRASLSSPSPPTPWPEILQLNQELFKNLQGLIDEDEARKRELLDTKNAYEMAQAEIARLERELRQSIEREADRAEELSQLEQERVDQLGAMSAHLDAMRSAVERYMQQGRRAA